MGHAAAMNSAGSLRTMQRWRRTRYSARPFCLTLLAIALISLLAWVKGLSAHDANNSVGGPLRARDLAIADQECRLVHHAHDQCAFVLANCPDEEAGVVSYLTFYYCRLPHAKPIAFMLMTLWLALLFSTIGIAASDFFCVNLNTIARMLGMSESLAGVTLLAFGNGSPDVFSTFAAFRTHAASLAVGELIGAACFITAVVSGSMALIRPFAVARKSFVRDVGFFLVAAVFSLGFIVDGKLHLWESVAMVAFYVFYVIFVVMWHWWRNARKARRMKVATMRSQFVMPGGDEEEFPEYHDDDTPAGGPTPSRDMSSEDFSALELASRGDLIEDDDNEEERERWMGELTNNMRVSRPNMTSRRSTHTPIRPSLVGALEFRAVLSSLQKSRNIQSMPISLRRYSDDPTYTTAQQQSYISTMSDPAARPPFDITSNDSNASPQVIRPRMNIQQNMDSRNRAVSTSDIGKARLQTDTLQGAVPNVSFGPATPDARSKALNGDHPPLSSTFSLSPPASPRSSRTSSPAPAHARHLSASRLAPPGTENRDNTLVYHGAVSPSPHSSPVLAPVECSRPPVLRLVVPDTVSPPIPFPTYTDYPWSGPIPSRPPSLRPRSPSASPESLLPQGPFGALGTTKILKWWPSSLVPPPHVLLSTLFPTLMNWGDKNIFDRMLAVIASVPVFLLTITLPVVEPPKNENDSRHAELSLDLGLPSPVHTINRNASTESRSRNKSIVLPSERHSDHSLSRARQDIGVSQSKPNSQSMSTVISQPPQLFVTNEDHVAQSPEALPSLSRPSESKQWNRWLVIVQIFTAPFFLVLILWANLESEHGHALVRLILYSLLGSLCFLALLLMTTTPSRPPRWRSALCFLGFAVAIAWISTIANEVVGVLRTLGVILNMSDAILGLTIFAVGNSLGDLVADITVARLGFPVMALSACFGGPMLNILLGVGLSGCYMIITKSEKRHDRHPDHVIEFRPYHIAVSTTLIISGATLLFTLAGLLVAVPWRGWKMDRMIGWGLIVLWCLSTCTNVLVEVLGLT